MEWVIHRGYSSPDGIQPRGGNQSLGDSWYSRQRFFKPFGQSALARRIGDKADRLEDVLSDVAATGFKVSPPAENPSERAELPKFLAIPGGLGRRLRKNGQGLLCELIEAHAHHDLTSDLARKNPNEHPVSGSIWNSDG